MKLTRKHQITRSRWITYLCRSFCKSKNENTDFWSKFLYWTITGKRQLFSFCIVSHLVVKLLAEFFYIVNLGLRWTCVCRKDPFLCPEYIYKITRVLRTLWLDKLHFLTEYRDTQTSFLFCIRVQKHEWHLDSLHHSNRKNTRKYKLRLVFSLGIFPVEVTSFMVLSEYRGTQAISYLLNKQWSKVMGGRWQTSIKNMRKHFN